MYALLSSSAQHTVVPFCILLPIMRTPLAIPAIDDELTNLRLLYVTKVIDFCCFVVTAR
jgi:hypothetical protein